MVDGCGSTRNTVSSFFFFRSSSFRCAAASSLRFALLLPSNVRRFQEWNMRKMNECGWNNARFLSLVGLGAICWFVPSAHFLLLPTIVPPSILIHPPSPRATHSSPPPPHTLINTQKQPQASNSPASWLSCPTARANACVDWLGCGWVSEWVSQREMCMNECESDIIYY